jgi:hypothetical protein
MCERSIAWRSTGTSRAVRSVGAGASKKKSLICGSATAEVPLPTETTEGTTSKADDDPSPHGRHPASRQTALLNTHPMDAITPLLWTTRTLSHHFRTTAILKVPKLPACSLPTIPTQIFFGGEGVATRLYEAGPPLTLINSATMLTAISSGVSEWISRPMGAWTRSRVSLEIPFSNRFWYRVRIFFFEPIIPM